jgi:hypothetical protein
MAEQWIIVPAYIVLNEGPKHQGFLQYDYAQLRAWWHRAEYLSGQGYKFLTENDLSDIFLKDVLGGLDLSGLPPADTEYRPPKLP